MMSNKPDAPNLAITSVFQCGRHWRRVGDPFRWRNDHGIVPTVHLVVTSFPFDFDLRLKPAARSVSSVFSCLK
jgi:hypothetical protein